jgi:subtilisin family serine protease
MERFQLTEVSLGLTNYVRQETGMKKCLAGLLGLALLVWAGAAMAQGKIKIEKLDDLPRHVYKVDMKATEVIQNDAALMKLAAEVRKDLEDDLNKYEIDDKTTLKDFYANLSTIALLEGNYDTYLSYLQKRKDLEDKSSIKATTGMFAQAYITAKKQGGDMKANFRAELKKLLDGLDYKDCEAIIKSNKGNAEIVSQPMMFGMIESSVQPVLDKSNGEMSKDIATGMLSQAWTVRNFIPLKDEAAAVYGAYISAHDVVKPDIWADREITLTGKETDSPVTVGIWDSGVDAEIFKNQMWTNTKEVPGNGKDDDNDGFVDDVHGIAWTLHSDKDVALLFPIGDVSKDRPRLQHLMKGLEDVGSGVESPEAADFKKTLSSVPQDSMKDFWEGVGKYGNYCHGTHVTGIATHGNPFARVLAARITFDYHVIPELPTVELAQKEAASEEATVDYFKKNGVRVVNMSWGNSLASVESALEANNWGKTPEERKAKAREIFEITRVALFNAIKNAPDILFVTSAGNSNNDVKFEEFYPSSFDLPNVLTVGAVDQAGEETSFTSFGKVDVYANGFEVMSYVPGGDQMKLSGTSMSSPNVVNLAAKLWAMNTKLTAAQVRQLIVDGCDPKTAGERPVKLINPKRSAELLAAIK